MSDAPIQCVRLWPAGGGDAGKEGPVPPTLAAAQAEVCPSPSLDPPTISRMLCSVSDPAEDRFLLAVEQEHLLLQWNDCPGPAGGA